MSAHINVVSCSSIVMTISSSGGVDISKQVLATITTATAKATVAITSPVSHISGMTATAIEAAVFEVHKAII